MSNKKKEINTLENAYAYFRSSFSLIDDIRPINIEAEKVLFFERIDSGREYNPVFEYEENSNSKYLTELEKFRNDFLVFNDHVGRIYAGKIQDSINWIKAFQSKGANFNPWLTSLYGTPDFLDIINSTKALDIDFNNQKPEDQESFLKPEEIEHAIRDRLKLRNINNWDIIWPEMTAGMAVNNNKRQIKVNNKYGITKAKLKSLLTHEIDTHVLRHENGRKSPYRLYQYGSKNYLPTEEGLAIYNEELNNCRLPKDTQKYILRLLGAHMVATESFYSVFKFISQFIDADTAFQIVTRLKRGLVYTGNSGGYTKDQVYYSGYLKIKKLSKEQLRKLYFGKVSIEELSYWKNDIDESSLVYPEWLE